MLYLSAPLDGTDEGEREREISSIILVNNLN